MAFWKKRQVPIEHLPIHDISDASETFMRLYGQQGQVSALMAYQAMNRREDISNVLRYRLDKATEFDGIKQWIDEENPRLLHIRVHGAEGVHLFEWFEWESPGSMPARVPLRVTASISGYVIPFVCTVLGPTRVRVGLASQFAIPLVYMSFMNGLEINIEFKEPLGSNPLGDITVQAAQLDHVWDWDIKQIVPLHPGDRSRAPFSVYPPSSACTPPVQRSGPQFSPNVGLKDCGPPEFLVVHEGCMVLSTLGRAARYVGQLGRFALTLQRRFRQRRMSHVVYEWTPLPPELCQIVGTLASAGEPVAKEQPTD
jgi:hypothetical protein